ncbi:MAG TPA: acetoin utilization protein AcuC, partial [Candidatus Bathyarchaeia archaeon]|nr:acetoin utilization protein AcuC [Candidatus Bathyarchaeia archaeon]
IRVKLTYELAKSKGVLEHDSVRLIHPRTASRDEILLFHEDSYIKLVESYSKKGSGLLDAGDTPAFKGCYEATALVVGASIAGADAIMSGTCSHAFNPSGGLHHAHPERASGFCIFNDPAVVIRCLKSKYNVKKLVYLDIDAHHGDGVMYGFYDDPALLDIDFHESGHYLFPGTGFPDETGNGEAAGLKLNIPLPPATGDQAYLEAFRQVVPKAIRDFRPEIMLVQCGADGHQDDRLAHLRLSTNAYSSVVGEMHQLAHELCNGRLLLFGGGGYTLANVPRVWTVALATLAGIKLDNSIPSSWAKQFEETGEESSPTQFHDAPTSDAESTRKQVQSTVAELRKAISAPFNKSGSG